MTECDCCEELVTAQELSPDGYCSECELERGWDAVATLRNYLYFCASIDLTQAETWLEVCEYRHELLSKKVIAGSRTDVLGDIVNDLDALFSFLAIVQLDRRTLED